MLPFTYYKVITATPQQKNKEELFLPFTVLFVSPWTIVPPNMLFEAMTGSRCRGLLSPQISEKVLTSYDSISERLIKCRSCKVDRWLARKKKCKADMISSSLLGSALVQEHIEVAILCRVLYRMRCAARVNLWIHTDWRRSLAAHLICAEWSCAARESLSIQTDWKMQTLIVRWLTSWGKECLTSAYAPTITPSFNVPVILKKLR